MWGELTKRVTAFAPGLLAQRGQPRIAKYAFLPRGHVPEEVVQRRGAQRRGRGCRAVVAV